MAAKRGSLERLEITISRENLVLARTSEYSVRKVGDRRIWEQRYLALDEMIVDLIYTVANDHDMRFISGESVSDSEPTTNMNSGLDEVVESRQPINQKSISKKLNIDLPEKLGVDTDHYPRYETFIILLINLREFAKQQFKFLYHGLSTGTHDEETEGTDPYGFLEPSFQYPEPYVLQATLDQIAFDLNLIQIAYQQRRVAQRSQKLANTFEIADSLAYAALKPAIDLNLIHENWPKDGGQANDEEQTKPTFTVITYLQKSAHIRIVPYANVALIGIPNTAVSSYEPEEIEIGRGRDLLSIPHEVGHYVYRHGNFNGGRLASAIREYLHGQPDYIINWLEEIFADIYGCLVAGPIMAFDFQDIMADNDMERFLEDDGEHPVPVLRPLIYVDILRSLADRFDDTGKKEQEKVAVWLRESADDAQIEWVERFGEFLNEDFQKRRERIRILMGVAIRRFVNLNLLAVDPDTQQFEKFWTQMGATKYDFYEKLWERVTDPEWRQKLLPVPELMKIGEMPLESMPELHWLKLIRDMWAEEAGAKRIPPEFWTLVVSMDGWAVNGPEGEGNPKVT